MRCTMDLAETSILVDLRSPRSHWVLAASTSSSFLMAQFGDDTGSSCSHATLLMRTTNLVMLWTTFLNCRRIIPWRYRELHHRFRDIPGPGLYHLSQSTDRTSPDDREGHVNPTKDIVVDAKGVASVSVGRCCRDCLHRIDRLDRSRLFQKSIDSSGCFTTHL